jgi:hypothetical protein
MITGMQNFARDNKKIGTKRNSTKLLSSKSSKSGNFFFTSRLNGSSISSLPGVLSP